MARKKAGQNKKGCLAYKNEKRREKNKLRKLNKHLKRHPEDDQGWATQKALKKELGMAA